MPPIHVLRKSVKVAARTTSDRLASLAARLMSGDIDADEFERRCAYHIRRLHTVAAVAANNTRPSLPPPARAILDRRLAEQMGYLHEFALQARADDLDSEAQAVNRARMYADAAHGSFECVARDIRRDSGFRWERRVMSRAEHCGDCVAFAAAGWQPINTLPPPGEQSKCRARCRCRFRYSRSEARPVTGGTPAQT